MKTSPLGRAAAFCLALALALPVMTRAAVVFSSLDVTGTAYRYRDDVSSRAGITVGADDIDLDKIVFRFKIDDNSPFTLPTVQIWDGPDIGNDTLLNTLSLDGNLFDYSAFNFGTGTESLKDLEFDATGVTLAADTTYYIVGVAGGNDNNYDFRVRNMPGTSLTQNGVSGVLDGGNLKGWFNDNSTSTYAPQFEVVAVPEPGSLALLLLGASGALLLRRRFRGSGEKLPTTLLRSDMRVS